MIQKLSNSDSISEMIYAYLCSSHQGSKTHPKINATYEFIGTHKPRRSSSSAYRNRNTGSKSEYKMLLWYSSVPPKAMGQILLNGLMPRRAGRSSTGQLVFYDRLPSQKYKPGSRELFLLCEV